jgi:hypothetical protein
MMWHGSIDVALFVGVADTQKISQNLPQRCSPCGSWPLRRGGYFGQGGVTFSGEFHEGGIITFSILQPELKLFSPII